MQTKYEQITELRETATLINQLEFKIKLHQTNIDILEKTNRHKENTYLIDAEKSVLHEFKTQMIKGKQVFDLLLINIKPYYN
jgi:hypothetical protein